MTDPVAIDNPTSTGAWRRFVLGKNPQMTVVRAGALALSAFLLFRFVLSPVRVTGISMEPTYPDGKITLINRMAYRWGAPARGDVVAIQTSGPSLLYFKRIIALPGERASISNNVVLINGRPLSEPYAQLNRGLPWRRPETLLQADEYLVIGDNRSMPERAHSFGEVHRWRLYGKAIF